MKAVVCTAYGGPEVLRIAELPRPQPGKQDVLIRVYASVVSAVEPVNRSGKPYIARLFSGLLGPKHSVPGDILAGRVEAVGAGVERFSVGDRVWGATGLSLGAQAEYIALPEEGALEIIPEELDYTEAAALCEPALTAIPFLTETARLEGGTRILINGASGAVGSCAVQLAVEIGAEVTGVCSAGNQELVRSLGAEGVIDYKTTDFTREGGRYGVIFDAVAKRSFRECQRALAPGGIYMTTFPSLGVLLGGKQARFLAAGLRPPEKKREYLAYARQRVAAGSLIPVIDRVYRLEEIAEAHRYVETGRKRGSVVLAI